MRLIKSINIQGFKAIASTQSLTLEDINVIIGHHDFGKATILHALEIMAHSARDYRPLHFVPKHLLHHGCQNASISVNIAGESPATILTFDPWLDRVTLASTLSIPSKLAHSISRWRIYDFSKLGYQPIADQNHLLEFSLQDDAANLPGCIARIRHEDPARHALMVNSVRVFSPKLSEALLADVPPRYDLFSPQELRLLAYTVMAHTTADRLPSVIMFQFPETDLEPSQTIHAAGLIQQLAFHHQILLTTESPRLVDALQPANVIYGAIQQRELHCQLATTADIAAWAHASAHA